MPWDAENAAKILDGFDNCFFIKPASSAKAVLKKTHRYFFKKDATRKHIVVSRERNEGAVTAYVNASSLAGKLFPKSGIPGVEISQEYFKGHIGTTGDHGIAGSVAKLDSLNPLNNDVLRLSVSGPSAFKELAQWYAGSRNYPESNEASGAESYLINQPVVINQGIDQSLEISSGALGDKHGADSMVGGDADVTSAPYMQDAERREIVERVAVDRAIDFYRSNGFEVTEKGKPYDLLCTKGELVVHVEVKGTTGAGERVVLTRNEILDARDGNWRSDLFVVFGIDLSCVDQAWVGSGGEVFRIESWEPKDKDLVATQFEYVIPRK